MSEQSDPGQPVANFTPRAQQTLALARNEADRFNHNFVGTEHILLGLLKLNQGVAVTVLRRLGLDLDSVREEIERRIRPGPEQAIVGNIPYTPRMKKVLALAAKEASALGHKFVGTEHFLLGLLLAEDGVAHDVLVAVGVRVAQTREFVLQELAQNPHAGSAPSLVNPAPQPDSIDTSKHYDVYCAERGKQVVYRNALFKARQALLPRHTNDFPAEFLQLQLQDGVTVFVARSSIIKFCEHGVTPHADPIRGSDENQ